MPVVLYRVDERLIHGQVILGWGSQLRPDHYVVVDDEIVLAEWEQELYRLALPPGPDQPTVEFITCTDAADRLSGWESSATRTVVLTRELETMVSLAAEVRLQGKTVNVGGVHYAPDRKELLPYLHLSESDFERIRWLDLAGVTVEAQDLPAAPVLRSDVLLRKGRQLWSG